MSLLIRHDLLVSGTDFDYCSRRVKNFFNASQLVRYDNVTIIREHSASGSSPSFQDLLASALATNRQTLAGLLEELQQAGCTTVADLGTLQQGFGSNILHTVAHFMDGFFGIDARFFDLDHTSYWITATREKELAMKPDQCWLVAINACSTSGPGFEGK